MKKLQIEFDSMVKQDLDLASSDQIKNVVLGIWHEGFVPDVEHLSGYSAAAAGYTIDKLMRFSCVSTNQKNALRKQVSLLKSSPLYDSSRAKSSNNKRDELAVKWGLNSDLKAQVKYLLPYQTRHFNAKA